jgi:hypothetical protein
VSASGFKPSTAQLTTFFNVQILSHFLIPYLLLSRPEPVLRTGAQICNIARPGEKNRHIDLDDFLCLKAVEAGTFRFLKDVTKFVFMVDLFTQVSRSDILPLRYLHHQIGIQYKVPRHSYHTFVPWNSCNDFVRAPDCSMVHSGPYQGDARFASSLPG